MKKYIIAIVFMFGFLASFSFVKAQTTETYAQCQTELAQISTTAQAKINQICAPLGLPGPFASQNTPSLLFPQWTNCSSGNLNQAQLNSCISSTQAVQECVSGVDPSTSYIPGETSAIPIYDYPISYLQQVHPILTQEQSDITTKTAECNALPDAPPAPVKTSSPVVSTPIPTRKPPFPISSTYSTYNQCYQVYWGDSQSGFDPVTGLPIIGQNVPGGGTESQATATVNESTLLAKCNALPGAPGNSYQSSTSSSSSTPPSPGSGLTSSTTPISTSILSCPVPTDITSLQNQITTLQTTNNSLTAQITTLEAQLTAAGITYSTTPPVVIAGCNNRTTGYSITTGQSCVGNTPIVTKTTSAKKVTTKK